MSSDIALLKAAALADRSAAILADDGVAQREAENAYNAAVDLETRARRLAGLKARIKAEEGAERAGYEAAEQGVGPERVSKIAPGLRVQWERGWNAYWNR